MKIEGCINKQITAFYITNHKAANTSITNCLLSLDSGWSDRGEKTKPANWSDYFTFTFVRNPYSRLVSRYKHLYYALIPEEYKPPGLDLKCNVLKWNLLNFFMKMELNVVKENFTFLNFVKFIKIWDNVHWLPQTKVILNGCGYKYNERNSANIHGKISFFGKMENIKEDWNHVLALLSLPSV